MEKIETGTMAMPGTYNAAADLIGRNLTRHPDKIAFIDDAGAYTYAELATRVDRFAAALHRMGVAREARILLCLDDGIDFPVACLGAIKAGVVPVMVNTLLTPADYDYMLEDSRAQLLVVSARIWPSFEPIVARHGSLRIVISGARPGDPRDFRALLDGPAIAFDVAATRADEACFWQYSSGSTGRPKGTIHVHGSVPALETYPRDILGLAAADVSFSAAKLFFGYGFGNGLIFPLATGATSVLMAGRPTPEAVFERLERHKVTIFYGVPTLYRTMLSVPNAPAAEALALRRCTSAGEALPAPVGQAWRERYGVDILDGIGSTEMLHIYLSNRPDDVRYGTTGRAVPGYELKLLDEAGAPVPAGEIGELYIEGPTAAAGYWNNREKTRATFLGEWTRSGDKFRQDADGRYVYCGRSDDMLKVGGIYVSPLEVETALLTHPAVQEAAVVGWPDDAGLIKPKAYVVLKDGSLPGAETEQLLKAHVKACLAPYKYPRWFAFVDALPKTATGKIERYKLRPPQ